MSGLWIFSLIDLDPTTIKLEHWITPHKTIKLNCKANNACHLQSVEALIKYRYTTTGFPIKETWLTAVKNNQYAT